MGSSVVLIVIASQARKGKKVDKNTATEEGKQQQAKPDFVRFSGLLCKMVVFNRIRKNFHSKEKDIYFLTQESS